MVGLIHVKDLLLLEIDHEVPLKALLPLIGRQVFIVDDDAPLPELLEEFRRGASQLAVVRGSLAEDVQRSLTDNSEASFCSGGS